MPYNQSSGRRQGGAQGKGAAQEKVSPEPIIAAKNSLSMRTDTYPLDLGRITRYNHRIGIALE